MKPIRSLLPAILVVLMAATPVLAQQRDSTLPRVSPNASTSFTLGMTNISVLYGAPSIRDRAIYGDLVPYNEVWRTGANESTAITFSTDVIVEGQPLSAGTYGLFTIPRPGDWTVMLNTNPEQWGAFRYDAEYDALRVEVAPRASSSRETMAVMFEDLELGDESDAVTLVVHWSDIRLPLRIETDTNAHVAARANRAVAEGDWERALAFSRYALQSGRNLDHARRWANAVIEHDESYATLSVAARLHAANGDYTRAAELGDRALTHAAAMSDAPQGLDSFRRDVNSWREER